MSPRNINKDLVGFVIIPIKMHLNSFFEKFAEDLIKCGCEYYPLKPWRLLKLVKYRKFVSTIIIHFPETLIRSNFVAMRFTKFLIWMLIIYISKVLGYKLVWIANNLFPHSNKENDIFYKLLQNIIIKKFDLVIGLSKNTYYDILNMHPINFTRVPYLQMSHGFRYICKKDIPLLNKKNKIRITIFFNNKRGNLNLTKQFLILIKPYLVKRKIEICVYGEKNIIQVEHTDIIYLEPQPNKTDLINAIINTDYVFLDYSRITTSSWLYNCLYLNTPLIAPNLAHFNYNPVPDGTLKYEFINGVVINFSSLIDSLKPKSNFDNKKLLDEIHEEYINGIKVLSKFITS